MRLIRTFSDGSELTFDTGTFDDWCVYLKMPGRAKYAPTDELYFTRLNQLADKHGHEKIYNDFVRFYELTSTSIEKEVLQTICEISASYRRDSLEIEVIFTIIYAGMVAEENKEKAILKKRIKRLGMHQTLMDRLPAKEAARFSKGKNWRELDVICREKGF